MRICDLEKALHECSRFTEKAELALKRLKNDKYASISGSKETGAAARASMDLSRALVEVRRGGNPR